MDRHLADLVLRNASVLTLEKRRPSVRTVYVQHGRILRISGRDIEKSSTSKKARVIDCDGRAVLPGFHDAHCHIVGYAESLLNIDISPACVSSISDIAEKIRQAAQFIPPGKWIRLSGYNEFYLKEKRHPTRFDLDPATTLHPVRLTHRSGHAHVLNTAALKATGISNETDEPEGGMIERDLATGEPDGILYGMGAYLARIIPPPDEADLAVALGKAGKNLLALGVTSLQDASPGNDLARWNQFLGWKRGGLFPPRIVMMFGAQGHESLQGKQPFYDKETGLGSGAIKIMLDEVRCSLNPPQAELNELVLALHRRGFQVALHAVEPNTVYAALNAIEFAQKSVPGRQNRHRLEHCSICTPETAGRIARLGVMVVTNPAFIYYSGDRYLATVPLSQRKHLYALNTMLEAGIRVAAGSDAPVSPPDPTRGIYAAITRRSETGRMVVKKETIGVEQAVRLYTSEAARSCFREKQLGTIAPGKLADMVVLNANPLEIPAEDLKHLRVEMTVLKGEIAYSEAI